MNKNSLNNLQPFKKGFDPRRNYAGGSRKLLSQMFGFGYTKREVHDTLMSIITLTVNEIKQVADNPDCTFLEVACAKALLKDVSKGSLWNTELILNHCMPKPSDNIKTDDSGKIEVIFVEGKTIL